MEVEFFQSLFAEKPDGLRILVWLLDGKRSYWAATWDEAAAYAEQHANQDVYVGVGLSEEDYGPKRRCDAGEIACILGLWADIDILGPAHKKTNLPPDSTAAEELIMSTGMQPTITIHSGHGLQVWWLFREPWIFDTPAEREQAGRLAWRWNATLRARAQQRTWDVDSTGDLSRVLRVPGTCNTKIPDDKRPVRLLSIKDEHRYNPSDFDEYLIDDDSLGWLGQARIEVNVVVNEHAAPPFTKFEVLGDNEPRFLKSWRRERRDLQDQSASAYDQSLASFAAGAGWADQEICDLLVASRRKHGDDLKRLDYYQRTIALARGDRTRELAFEMIDELSGADAPVDDVERRTRLLTEISKLIGVEIRHIIKHTMDPPRYRLETTKGDIELGDIGNLIGQATFRKKLAAATSRLLPPFKTPQWSMLAQLLLDVCEESVPSDETTDAGRGRAWLALYLADHKPVELEKAASKRQPYLKDERIHVFSTALRKWITATQMENVTYQEMNIVLRSTGCTPLKEHVSATNTRTTAPAWRLPDEGVDTKSGLL